MATRAGLRPSPDRVRETLFNWLMPYLPGACCLDLYAGSGVLGFEAVSRGAASATLVELEGATTAELAALRARLNADTIEVCRADVIAWLDGPARAFDIVFVDPPFATALLEPTLAGLAQGWLSPSAVVYIEGSSASLDPGSDWQVLKSARTREVEYALLRRSG